MQLYKALKQKKLLDSTPIVFCEGDSWFSTQLAMNLLDWIVSPAPDDEAKGVPLFGKGVLANVRFWPKADTRPPSPCW